MFELPFRLDSIPWESLIVPAVGIGATALVLLASLFFLGKQQRSSTQVQKQPERDPFLEGASSDRRKAARRGGNLVEVLVATEESKDSPVRGVVLDRSLGGLCLHVDEPVAQGTVLCVKPANASPMVPWTDVEVRSCRPRDNGWDLGCQFARVPPWSVLLLFG